MDATGRRVLISGGKGGLARAMEREFKAQGALVETPGHSEMSVRDEKRVQAYFARFERLDVLIANAGLTRDGPITGLKDESFSDAIDTNLRGAFLCARAALKLMIGQRSGHILFIGSRAGRYGTAGQSVYAAAKAGLVGLAQSIAREYGPRNIRCNVVLPGFLETPMTEPLSAPRREAIRGEHALGRFNTVENAARFIVYLSELDHVSGQVFTLDSRIDRWT
jgi:3-oxoacyl-[acyl-carrier protein] reductase